MEKYFNDIESLEAFLEFCNDLQNVKDSEHMFLGLGKITRIDRFEFLHRIRINFNDGYCLEFGREIKKGYSDYLRDFETSMRNLFLIYINDNSILKMPALSDE